MIEYVYDILTRQFRPKTEYIYQRKNGWYEIRKRVGGVLLYWGSFPTLEEAELHKAYYIGKNWQVSPAFKANRHITQKGNRFIIMKTINGKNEYFGTFKNIEDARHERDVCERCNWEYDLIVEYED